MKLQIGEKIKHLRHENNVTQEHLAEILGVSCQSVSRWELGICYPDIELLPTIANYFDITLDNLIGMNDIRSEAKRNEIFTTILNYEKCGNWNEAATILRNAIRTYPNDDGLLTELALVLSKTNDAHDHLEAITLSEKVLTHCTNEKIRSTARANLCFLYQATGQSQKAIDLGKTLPHIWECREILLPDLVSTDERAHMVSRTLNIVLQVLKDLVSGKKISFSLGYKAEDNVNTNNLFDYLSQDI